MNKKLIIGIIAGVVALAVIITAAVLIINSLDIKDTGAGSSSEGSSLSSGTVSDAQGSGSSTAGNTSETASGGAQDKPVNKGDVGIKDVTASAGDIVKIPINISENPGICAAKLSVKYDSSALEYLECEDGKILGAPLMVNPTDGVVSCIMADGSGKNGAPENQTANGALVTFVFEVKKDAKAGEYTVTIDEKETEFAKTEGASEQLVKPTLKSGKVIVK